jgi:drug/metabolite transporter (DMT)-like permease
MMMSPLLRVETSPTSTVPMGRPTLHPRKLAGPQDRAVLVPEVNVAGGIAAGVADQAAAAAGVVAAEAVDRSNFVDSLTKRGCVENATPFFVRHAPWLAFAALSVVWGSTWFASDTFTQYVPPLRGSAARFLLAAILCLPVILAKRVPLPRGRALGFILQLSATMIAVPLLLLLWAKQYASSATVTVLFAAMPLLVVLMTPVAVPRRALQAAMVGLGAMSLVVNATPTLAQAGGAAVALIAVAFLGASSLTARRELSSVHPVMVVALLTGAAAVLLFLASLVVERGQPAQWNQRALGSLIFLSAVAGAPAYATYFWLLQEREAYQVATLQWIEPMVAVGETALFLRLPLSLSVIAASLVTLVCLLLVMQARAEDDKNVSLLGK